MTAGHRLREIRLLDPVRDHQRIVHLLVCYEFPWDMTRSLEFALFRTFCSPRVSELLNRTREFQSRPQKRYDDTDIIVSELMEWGYDSERGRAALRRMNQQHSRFDISNEDMLYVLSTFIYEPIRWNARFGWRLMCEQERMAIFYFWREVGRRMGIRDVPDEYGSFERFNLEYEKARFSYTDANHRVGTAVVGMFAGWFPRPMRPLVGAAIYSLMDDSVLQGFGFRKPSAMTRAVVLGGLRLRGKVLRWLPKRRRPRLRTQMRHRTYPQGYTMAQLGPPGT